MADQIFQNEDKGFCPACECETQSLPEPAFGCCAVCFNHQLKINDDGDFLGAGSAANFNCEEPCV